MEETRRKRPLATATTNQRLDCSSRNSSSNKFIRSKLGPPPKTATVLRLEQMLDDDPNKRTRPRKRLKKQSKNEAAVANVKSSSVTQPSSTDDTRGKNVLAFQGGLAAAPTFRKAAERSKMILRGNYGPTSSKKVSKTTITGTAIPLVVNEKTTEDSNEDTVKTDKVQDETAMKHVDYTLSSTADDRDKVEATIVGTNKSSDVLKEKASTAPGATVTQSSSLFRIGLQRARRPPRNGSSNTIDRTAFSSRAAISKDPAENDKTDEPEIILPAPNAIVVNVEAKADDALLPPKDPAAELLPIKSHSTAGSSKCNGPKLSSRSITTPSRTNQSSPDVNDNYVRLNLRNSAGACRGARNKKAWRRGKQKEYYQQRYPGQCDNKNDNHDDYDHNINKKVSAGSNHGQAYVSRMTGLDPMDDYLDGVYEGKSQPKATVSAPKKSTTTKSSSSTQQSRSEVPLCTRHQRPCKLVVVKKNTKGNKGRKFYACSLPRGEQCDHFQWAEDTLEAARQVVADNSNHSRFVARQVAAHMDRFKVLTAPELRNEAARRNLNKAGNKKQLLMRLALWARDELVKAVPHPDNDDDDDDIINGTTKGEGVEIDLDDSDSDAENSASNDDVNEDSSDEELEIFNETNEHKNHCDWETEEGDQESQPPNENEVNVDPSLKLVTTLKSIFGFSEFRDGQEWAIERCLAGKRSLLVAPTGFGKSLCYALPAALMDGICVVVSPLISLIQDQLRSLPPSIPGATLSGSLSASATAAIIDDVIRKRLKILFVSPERLTSPSFRRLFNTRWNPETQQRERRFPEISLLCVDEAHCVSQWAHNFRPCFLRFKGLLHLMRPKSVLAVTATAGSKVIQDISKTLDIGEILERNIDDAYEQRDILVIDKARDNIDVSCQFVTNHEERLDMLSKILKPGMPGKGSDNAYRYFGVLSKGSVIVYVWRQRDTEVVAENLTSAGVTGGIVMYHGGMDASARTKAQSKFMRGKARICVATVAFGMGIDKADVEGIIHLYLSSSPEHYLQEIGRAGRDGRQARAIALPTIEEVPVRHSLVHTNYISKCQIRALLYTVQELVADSFTRNEYGTLNIALPVESLVLKCDCKVETIETLLSILEQTGGDEPLLQVEGFNYDHAMIALKKRSMEKLAEKEQVAKCIKCVATCIDPPIGEEREQGESPAYQSSKFFNRQFLAYSRGSYSFSVAKSANALGPSAESRHIFAALRRLQSTGELELSLDTSPNGRVILVKLSAKGQAFFTSAEFGKLQEDMTNMLHASFAGSMFSGADKVLDINHILHQVCHAGEAKSDEPKQLSCGKSQSLKKFQEMVKTYFTKGLKEETEAQSRHILPKSFFAVRIRELENDLVALMRDLPILAKPASNLEHAPIFGDSRYADYSAVAAAKFLHGLDSPRAPAQAFRSHSLFGKWKDVQFCLLLESVGNVLHAPSTAKA